MVMRLVSYFKIGITLVIIGSVWVGILFSGAAKNSDIFLLDKSDPASVSLNLHGAGVGFYIISIDGYGGKAIAKIVDSHRNYDMQKITNTVTVHYFQFRHPVHFRPATTNV